MIFFQKLLHFPDTCAPISLENGLVNYTTSPVKGRYLVDTVASFSCDLGFYLNGTNSAICETSKQWNNETPTCEGFYYLFFIIFTSKRNIYLLIIVLTSS